MVLDKIKKKIRRQPKEDALQRLTGQLESLGAGLYCVIFARSAAGDQYVILDTHKLEQFLNEHIGIKADQIQVSKKAKGAAHGR